MVKKTEKSSLVLIVHNVRSALNVGALFRTADGAGVTRIILSGYTPCPHSPHASIARQAVFLTKAEKSLAKTALGAEKNIPWQKTTMFGKTLTALKKEGFAVVALEQHEKSLDYRQYVPQSRVALIVGNEVRGVDARVVSQCDAVIDIPMRGKKNSLNVAIAGGIALYQIASTMEREHI